MTFYNLQCGATMYKTIQMLEMIGQNSSIKQYETAHDMLVQENISDEGVNDLIDSNIPLMCVWVTPDEKDNETEDDDEGEKKEKKGNKINIH